MRDLSGYSAPTRLGDAIVLINRLHVLLDREDDALRASDRRALEGVLAEKARLLHDLSKLSPIGSNLASTDRDGLVKLVTGIRTRLDENMKRLQIHLRALGSVVDTISNAIEKATSDGTYQRGY